MPAMYYFARIKSTGAKKSGACTILLERFSAALARYNTNTRDLEKSLHDKRFVALAYQHWRSSVDGVKKKQLYLAAK